MKIIKYSQFEYLNEEEGLWQNIKYGLSKLGRYKAGGSIFGKGETDKKAAQEIGEIMGNTSNAVIKAVYNEVQKRSPEFPNDKSRVAFLRGVILYGQLYDSLVAAAEKSPGDEGYLDPTVANALIENLRKVVKKALDVDLSAVYSVMDSNVNIDVNAEERLFEELLSEDYETAVNEELFDKLRKWKDNAMDKLFGKEDEDSEARKSGSRQSAKLQGAGDDETVDSERMKTLDSNKLPMILMGAGAALGALGWIASTEWFKDLVTTTIEHPAQYGERTFTKTVEQNLNVDDRGWSYTIQNNGFADATGKTLNFNQPVGNLDEAFKFYGGGDKAKGIEAMSHFLGKGNSSASVAEITRQLADPTNKTVGDVFNHLEGTWGDGFFMNQAGGAKAFIAKQVYKQTQKFLIKAAFKTTTTSVIGGKLIALAPVLGALGIALIGAGAVVKLLREKGKRQSRAKTLNDLLQSLKLVTITDKNSTQSQGQGQVQAQKEKEKVADEKSIYPIMIKNLKALNSMIISSDGVELEGQGSDKKRGEAATEYGRKFEVGKEYLYTNKEGEKKKVILVSKTHSMKKGADKQWATGDDEIIKGGKLPNSDTLSVAIKGKDGKYANVSTGVLKSQLAPLNESLLQEKQFTKGPRRSTITKEEDYLTQAVKNIRKSLKSLIDEKDKGVAITSEFVQEILDVKMSSDSKKPIKALYQEIYEYLYGKKSKTLSDFSPLYKESLKYILPKSADNPQGGKMDVVAEKVARLSKRTMQFEGEGFYSGLGEFGEDMKEFNETLKVIMEYCKSKSGVNESRIVSFKNFKS
jgi:hypothetical protein